MGSWSVKYTDLVAGLAPIAAELLAADLADVTIERDPPGDTSDQPWLTVKYGASGDEDIHGVTRVRVWAGTRGRGSADESPSARDLIIKVNPVHGIGETLIPWIVQHHDVSLDQPYATFHSTAETVATGVREAAIYDLSAELPHLRHVLPAHFGTISAGGERAIVLADESPLTGLTAGGTTTADWTADQIDIALVAIAAVHAETAEVASRLAWLPQRPTTTTMSADSALWSALLDDASRRFPQLLPADSVAHRRALIDTLPRWHPAKDRCHQVLVHNDFNPRNVGFRSDGTTIALDWEIARRDTPQRDVAELLTFTLTDSASLGQVLGHAERHHDALAKHGLEMTTEEYLAGLAADLNSEAINRMGMQLLFECAFDLPYMQRVNRTIDHLTAITAPWLR